MKESTAEFERAFERKIELPNAAMCVPYVLGYVQGLQASGVLLTVPQKIFTLQFKAGMSNAIRDAKAGVIVTRDTDMSQNLRSLIKFGNFPLTEEVN
jgi:hypothetical protein